MLSDIQLPEEYAKGLEGLLLKEQERRTDGRGDRHPAEAGEDCRACKPKRGGQKVKQAEGAAQSRVVEAKARPTHAIHAAAQRRSRLSRASWRAEARKEATIQNAEADAQAKVIDSKAELERRNLLGDAEANRVRLMAKANAERG